MFRGYLAIAALAAIGISASAETVKNKATVRAVRDGAADVSTDEGKTWKPAKVGARLGENAVIRTDNTATVDLFLGENGPVVRVTKGTTLGIDKLDYEDSGIEKVIDTQLDLSNGKILGNVKKMAAASKYEVKTPKGVAGIRGTEYSISADGTVVVVSGTVIVVYIVDGKPQPPVVVTGGNIAVPPTADGQPVTIRPGTLTPGDTIPQIDDIVPPPPVTVVVVPVPDSVDGNFDTTNGPLTRTDDSPAGTSNNTNLE